MTSCWPFDALTITTPELVLRPVRDGDLPALVRVFPDDFDLDPRYPPVPGIPASVDRERRLLQSIWRHRGCWSLDEWALDFGVWRGGDLIGVQTLEGTRFLAERTVDTASWIAKPFRGSGFGMQARASVLGFAFEHLHAERAITSALRTNQASLGVSRHLGYRDTQVRSHDTGHSIVELQHLILTRDEWAARGSTPHIEVRGFDACRPFFGPA